MVENNKLVDAVQDSQPWSQFEVSDVGLGVIVAVEGQLFLSEKLSQKGSMLILVEDHDSAADPSHSHCVL